MSEYVCSQAPFASFPAEQSPQQGRAGLLYVRLPGPSPRSPWRSREFWRVSGPTSEREELRPATRLLMLLLDNKPQCHLTLEPLPSQPPSPSVWPGKWPRRSEATLWVTRTGQEVRGSTHHWEWKGWETEGKTKGAKNSEGTRKAGAVINGE